MDAALRNNVVQQRDRLLEQLKDLDELRAELDVDEYEAMKSDTIAQLKEFDASLAKMVEGNMTLQSELDATRMAVRAAISEAFKTPDVIRMFAQKEPAALRRRLAEIDRDVKLGKLDHATVADQVWCIIWHLFDCTPSGLALHCEPHRWDVSLDSRELSLFPYRLSLRVTSPLCRLPKSWLRSRSWANRSSPKRRSSFKAKSQHP